MVITNYLIDAIHSTAFDCNGCQRTIPIKGFNVEIGANIKNSKWNFIHPVLKGIGVSKKYSNMVCST